jgi:hypothetical protein
MSLRRFVWAIVAGLLVVAALGIGASTALGQHRVKRTTRSLPGSNFDGGDGNQADGSGFDWQGLYQQYLAGEAVFGHTMDFAGPSIDEADDQFTSGSKELDPGDWQLRKAGAPPAKDNIFDIYRGFEHAEGGDAFLYLAFVREDGFPADSSVTLELNQRPGLWTNNQNEQVPCRTDGDLLVTFQVSGNVVQIEIDKWVSDMHASNGCALTGDLQPLPASDYAQNVEAAFNSGSIQNYLPGHTAIGGSLDAGRFGETAINLTNVLDGLNVSCENTTFTSAWAHSRASDELTSEMKDYVAPQQFIVNPCKASPALSSTTASRAKPGTPIFDTAHLSGGEQPAGKITFDLYGPNDQGCSRSPIFTTARDVVNGNGDYVSDSFTPRVPGIYNRRCR